MNNAELDAKVIEIDARQGAIVLRRVHDFLGRFIVYPSQHAHVAHSLWILHSHLMHLWDSTPRLAFLSPEPASGKSRALEATEPLVPRPVIAVNVSPAYLFRKVGAEETPPTILHDEIDTVFGAKTKDNNEEVRALLNAGHRRGAVAGRCVTKGKTVETEEIPAYAAVALAGLGWLPDTILSRSVVIRMRRRKPGEQVEPWRQRIHIAQGKLIRAATESWARSVEDVAWPELPAGIQDRDADVWEPLIAVADLVGGWWPKRARKAAVELVAAARDAEPSLGIQLLTDLVTVFAESDAMATKTILRALIDMEESPWGDIRGKPLDERRLARLLRQYSIKSISVRIGDDTPKGYRRADLTEAWASYLPPSPTPRKSATSATPPQIADVADVADSVADNVADNEAKNPNRNNRVADVADVADFRGDGRAEGSSVAAVAAVADFQGNEPAPPDDPWHIPPVLDRRDRAPALGPPGDSLDDFTG
jgi:Protein of unknown function (DUF3631)